MNSVLTRMDFSIPAREKELRELRKLNVQYEEQNAILSKHVDELKSVVSSLDDEVR